MSKIETYRTLLQDLDDWDPFLLQESNLPGPRANLELAFAVALEGDVPLFLRYAALNAPQAPPNSPQEFLAFCGVLGLGYRVAQGQTRYLATLRSFASDPRWRIREAVALGLQQYGKGEMSGLLGEMERWLEGNLLERRAVVAALCEPDLLRDPRWAPRVFNILDRVTASILVLDAGDRKSEPFRVLRKGLGYGWSVAVAAQPEIGKGRIDKWIDADDRDVRWIMKQNLRKKRLARMDEEWVNTRLERLG